MEKFIKKYIHKKTGATYTVTSPELEEYFSRNTSEYTSEDEILKGKKTSSLFSTHPSIEDRISAIENLE